MIIKLNKNNNEDDNDVKDDNKDHDGVKDDVNDNDNDHDDGGATSALGPTISMHGDELHK